MKRIVSGIQPTGNLHLGNYIGAIKNWVNIAESDTAERIYFIADLHAITVAQDPAHLLHSIRTTAATYMACGIDPEKAIIFNQSAVSAHAELGWILSCHATIGKLNRMTQFKDKAGKNKERASLGLYSYPVLMAADILAYQATHVPVGDDQRQHLELTRDIASVFNERYGQEFFPMPQDIIMSEGKRIMSLRDGRKKMSKSDESEYACILLTDSADTIAKKVKKAKSDMAEGISFDVENRPEASNLLTIYAAINDMSIEQAEAECGHLQFSAFKQTLADSLIAHLEPITTRINELLDAPDHLDVLLKKGAERADAIARPILDDVKRISGFFVPK